MKLNILLVVLSVIAIVMIAVFVIVSRGNKQNQPQIVPSPINSISTVIPTIVGNTIQVVSVDPLHNQQNVPIQTPIKVTFNKPVATNDVTVYITPETKFSTETNDTVFFIKPDLAWKEGSLYRYTLVFTDIKQTPFSFSFQTVGKLDESTLDTFNEGSAEAFDKMTLKLYPDVFLSNKTPYETNTFSVRNDFIKTPTEHFFFTVTSINNISTERVKLEFTNWLKTLGFTDELISKLDIRYQ